MITNIHKDIGKELIEVLQKKSNQSILTYDELCKKIGNQVNCRNVSAYLDNISCWCDEIGAFMLFVFVVKCNKNRPEKGFYRLYAELYGTTKNMDEELTCVLNFRKFIHIVIGRI